MRGVNFRKGTPGNVDSHETGKPPEKPENGAFSRGAETGAEENEKKFKKMRKRACQKKEIKI